MLTLGQAIGDQHSASLITSSVICYRIHTILCACRVGFGGKLEEGGRRLEWFVI
jgi:hypothetical protein